MNKEKKKSLVDMEEIPLEDTDRTSMEYRVLMAYTQRRLSASKYGQLLEREVAAQEESKEIVQDVTLAKFEAPLPEISPADHKPPTQKKDRKRAKKKKTRSNWKCLWVPSCLRPQAKDARTQGVFQKQDSVNGHSVKLDSGVGALLEGQNDSDISRLAERLAEIVDHSRSPPARHSFQVVERTLSLEEDGSWASKATPETVEDEIDSEEKIIDAIVALLQKSGDELEEKMHKDKNFCQHVWDMMPSYAFFKRVTDQFLEEAPIDFTVESENQVKSVKVALIMEATTRLTAMDNHPMNLVLGFGTKYLQENFSPWIQNQGGWGKALGLPDQEEVE